NMLFAASNIVTQHYIMLICVLSAVVAGVVYIRKSPRTQALWDRWRMKMPIVGSVIRIVAITRFCRILGTMLANGVPILQSLGLSKDAAGSVVLAESIEQAAESIRAGEPLAEPLRASGLFPPEILAMISVAEESNQLEKVLVQIADNVERRVNRQLDQAVRLIEPLILVLIAGAISLVAVGLLIPIFTMSQTMK
ncbi:MAG: type II secretion system F family protein, partial [Planctomycetaceae bacterium]